MGAAAATNGKVILVPKDADCVGVFVGKEWSRAEKALVAKHREFSNKAKALGVVPARGENPPAHTT